MRFQNLIRELQYSKEKCDFRFGEDGRYRFVYRKHKVFDFVFMVLDFDDRCIDTLLASDFDFNSVQKCQIVIEWAYAVAQLYASFEHNASLLSNLAFVSLNKED